MIENLCSRCPAAFHPRGSWSRGGCCRCPHCWKERNKTERKKLCLLSQLSRRPKTSSFWPFIGCALWVSVHLQIPSNSGRAWKLGFESALFRDEPLSWPWDDHPLSWGFFTYSKPLRDSSWKPLSSCRFWKCSESVRCHVVSDPYSCPLVAYFHNGLSLL